MTRGGGTHGDGADDLEVIDLEPSEPAKPRRDTARATGVRRRRRPVAIALVVVAALVGTATFNWSQRVTRKNASTSTTVAGQTDTSPLFPFRVGAQILTGGAGGLRLVDTDTGRITTPRIKDLPQGPATIVAHSGGTVAVRVGKRLYWLTLKRRVAYPVDDVATFPDAQRGYLWLASARTATLVPGGSNPIATNDAAIGSTRNDGLLVTTNAGIVLQPNANSGPGRSRMLLRAPATVIGVHPDRVAWVTNDCGVLRCPVHVTEIATGATATWLQLVGHPSPLVAFGSSAVFSPDGKLLAIVSPDENVTRAETLIVADLRSRATTVINALGRWEEPARPGSEDATGTTVDWTLDGRFLLLAPASGPGAGRVGLVDPRTERVTASPALGLGSTIAAIGMSTAGPLDYPRRDTPAPIDSGGSTLFGAPGLSLIGADAERVDLVDLATGLATTWPIEGPVPDAAGPNSIARVVGGWLVVHSRDTQLVVDLLPDGGGARREVATGFQVFSSDEGRHAWIVDVGQRRVQSYDPATSTLGDPITYSGQLAAVDEGLVIASHFETQTQTRLDIVDPSGRVRQGAGYLDSPSVEILAAGGTRVMFRDEHGLHLYDLSTGAERLITAQRVVAAALSPNGQYLVWIDSDDGPARRTGVRLMAVDSSTIVQLARSADRVLVANDGTVLFTNGVDVNRGRVGLGGGSSPVYGLAPDPAATLALG